MGPYSDKGSPARLADLGLVDHLKRLCARRALQRDRAVGRAIWAHSLATAARAYLAARDRVDPAGEAVARRRLEGLLAEVVE